MFQLLQPLLCLRHQRKLQFHLQPFQHARLLHYRQNHLCLHVIYKLIQSPSQELARLLHIFLEVLMLQPFILVPQYVGQHPPVQIYILLLDLPATCTMDQLRTCSIPMESMRIPSTISLVLLVQVRQRLAMALKHLRQSKQE